MPISTAPAFSRVSSAAISTRPTTARMTLQDVTSPRPTSVASLVTTMPAFRIAMRARKKPIPAAVAILRERGKAFTIQVRIGNTEMRTKQTPEMKRAPSATSQGCPIPSTTPYVK